MATFGRSTVVFSLLFALLGCAAGPSSTDLGMALGQDSSHRISATPARSVADHRDRTNVQRAVAYDNGDRGAVQQTAASGPIDSMTSSVKAGVNKVENMFSPESPPKQNIATTSLATKSEPTPELYVAVARLNESRGNLEEAERQYQEALKLAPDRLEALVGLGRLRDRQGQSEEAIQWYQKALKAHPKEASVYNDLGLCFARKHLYPKAVEALQRAVELQPAKPLYHNNLAMVLVETGDNDAAFAQLVAVHGEAAACYNLGYLVYKKGQYDLAARLFNKAAERDPSLTEAKVWALQAQASLTARPAAEKSVVTAPALAGSRPAPTATAPSSAPMRQARRPEPVSAPTRQLPPIFKGNRSNSTDLAPLPPTDADAASGSPTRSGDDATSMQSAPLPPDLQAEPQLLPPVAR